MPNTNKHPVADKETNATLAPFILQSLPLGVVVFDKLLKTISANQIAGELLDIQANLDVSLAGGTNEKIWGDWKKTLSQVVQIGKICRFDNVAYRKNDKQSVLQITGAPLTDGLNGVILGGLLLLEDITEKATAQKQMANTERLAAMGKLASKVAHELNNPIDGIMRYINLAKRTISEANLPKPVEYLEHASDGLKRMVQIITELLEFSRNRYSSLEDTPIDKLIDDAIKFIEPAAKATSVEIERRYPSGLPTVKGGNLFQVFCNLLKNAVEAMSNGGKVVISWDISEDNIAVIKFRDTGPGFEPENSEEIFEPFFTTKTGKGTGLGLAICRDIIEKYSGKITAQNSPQGGSVFTVHLPLNKK
ncbi:MAG: ATP-binding protein [Phycisphaerae bacterium]|nr:ATP-binding protein [Phycisphaerae bacterium]